LRRSGEKKKKGKKDCFLLCLCKASGVSKKKKDNPGLKRGEKGERKKRGTGLATRLIAFLHH